MPTLRELGFKVKSNKRWLRGNSTDGWIVVDIGGNRSNTRDEGDYSVSVLAWPPGTWEWKRARSGTSVVEPDSTLPPLFASADLVVGECWRDRPDIATYSANMSEADIAVAAQRLLDFARSAISWVESVLRSESYDEYTSADFVLGAAEVTDHWTPSRIALLERLTLQAQQGSWKPAWTLLAHWREVAGLPPVPFPEWHHPLMRLRPPLDRYRSPRAAFEAGHGSAAELLLPDGQVRVPTPEDFPDARQLDRWRQIAADVPDQPPPDPPAWLPWHQWVFLKGGPGSGRPRWLERLQARPERRG